MSSDFECCWQTNAPRLPVLSGRGGFEINNIIWLRDEMKCSEKPISSLSTQYSLTAMFYHPPTYCWLLTLPAFEVDWLTFFHPDLPCLDSPRIPVCLHGTSVITTRPWLAGACSAFPREHHCNIEFFITPLRPLVFLLQLQLTLVLSVMQVWVDTKCDW